jgi:iron complex outermembrane recepter protein
MSPQSKNCSGLVGIIKLSIAILAAAVPTVPHSLAAHSESAEGSPDDAHRSSLADEVRWLRAEGLTVTSVSRHPEELFTAPAAIHVITSDDIRRSGAQSIPEALRLAPGVSVAQITGNKTAVGARGLSNIYSPFLLVLVDGRSIYQVNNSGVNWILEDTLLEDVDRIEVVRGPGGTLWGANAVNGVINIVTKSAAETTGVYGSAGIGTEQRAFTYGRWGGALGQLGWVRGYFKFQDRQEHKGGTIGSA